MTIGKSFVALFAICLAQPFEGWGANSTVGKCTKPPVYTVCKGQFNSLNEINEFMQNLDPCDFEVIDLTTYARPGDKAADWFGRACEAFDRDASKICDVLLLSGHFAGEFFGSNGAELDIDTLEKYSCNYKCNKILHQPRETFLFGCNTLATKEGDSRTPGGYVTIQGHHGISTENAEENAAIRYDPSYGESFRSKVSRIFPSTPNIYGFDSPSPGGKIGAAAIRKYFENRKRAGAQSYTDHITDLYLARDADVINRSNELLSKFGTDYPWVPTMRGQGLAFTHCSGVGAGDTVKRNLCELKNDSVDVSERAQLAWRLLKSPDFSYYAPSVMSFLKENEFDIPMEVLVPMGMDSDVSQHLDEAFAHLSEFPTLQVKVLRAKRTLGLIDGPSYERQTKKVLSSLTSRLNSVDVKALCSLSQQGFLYFDFNLSDFSNPGRLRTKDGQLAESCLCPGGDCGI